MNKRIVAVAAVLLLAVPAYAAAAQIVRPGVTEELVEGHTVFTVIESASLREVFLEGAAVGVLVREREEVKEEFRGVLWFNDQFLVNPEKNQERNVRYPCGGAIMAVNEDDPDPRLVLALAPGGDLGVLSSAGITSSSGSGGDFDDLDLDPSTLLGSDDDVGDATTQDASHFTYVESYGIYDPNDHKWVVDKYNVTVLLNATTEYTYPVWVVNLGGGDSPFVADDGTASCPEKAYLDDPKDQSDVNNEFVKADNAACNDNDYVVPPAEWRPYKTCLSGDGKVGNDENNDGIPEGDAGQKPNSQGYYEPTNPGSNGGKSYCYDGNERQGINEGRSPGSGCYHDDGTNPLRRYNGVLFFFFGDFDVRVTGAAEHGASDTNGCESTATYKDGTPKEATEWLCPDGDDGKEGNSHQFKPKGAYTPCTYVPVTNGCLPNTGTVPGHGAHTGVHKRGQVDVYFDGLNRPTEPVTRQYPYPEFGDTFNEPASKGSGAGFH